MALPPPRDPSDGRRSGYEALPTDGEPPPGGPGRHTPLFVPLTAAACIAALVYELYDNGRSSQAGRGGDNEDCAYRVWLHGALLCAASLASNPLVGPPSDVLVRLGAKRNESILEDGEVWRLVAPLFLHAGVVHLALNMAALLQLGSRLEGDHGALRVGAVYLTSGIYGVVMSAVMSPHSVSVGASGAIFGLLGAHIGEVILNWGLFDRPCLALCETLFVASLQLLVGTTPMVDNFAHFFGFCMGLVCGMGVLASPQAARQNLPLGGKCQKHMLQALASSAAYLLFVAGLLALYGGWDPYSVCSWCGKIACLPFPWGCNASTPGACWWDCSPCAAGELTARTYWVGSPRNGSVDLRCPLLHGGSDAGFVTTPVWPVDLTHMRSAVLVRFCKEHCRVDDP